MGIVPPRPILPRRSYGSFTAQEVADAFSEALTPPWYSLWIADGLTTQRYGSMSYQSPEEAQTVCDALQDVYERMCWDCQFSVRERDRVSGALPECDSRLISIIG